MLKLIILLSLISAPLVLSQSELNEDATLDDFLNSEVNGINNFIHNQMDRIKQVVKSTYVGIDVDKFQNHVNNYLEQRKKVLAADVNGYVGYLKASGKKVADLWSSFVPTIDPDAKMENPESKLSVPAIIARNGYDCETHTIVSQGHILNIHRIPRPKNSVYTSRDTVILHHGLFDSSYNWIINGPGKSLGYVLADAEYDVWIPNARGNIHGREHAWFKTDTKEFWNFSHHELAQYDVPALIDYIQQVKGDDAKIAYVGHSMGSTILFTMLSLRPEYNEKLTVGVALAPSVFLSNMKLPFRKYKNFVTNVANAAMWYHSYEIFQQDFIQKLSAHCRDFYGQMTACQELMFYLFGEDREQLNTTILSNALAKSSSISWKTVLHYIQMINSGEFKQFDYGKPEHNKLMYGYETPPNYELSKVKLNLTLFWAQNDKLINEKDVLLLYDELPSTTQLYMIPFSKFNHADYLWAKDAPTLVNEKLLDVLFKAMKTNNNVNDDV